MLEPNRNRANGCWKRKTDLEKKLIFGCCVLFVIALWFAVLYILKISSESRSNDECTTKNCVQAASELLEFVDLKEDPCVHFYRYVCGGYYKHAVKRERTSPFITINKEFKNEMKSLVVDPVKKKDSHANVLLKQFYHECMNESKIDHDNNRAFMKVINDLGGWPLLNGSAWNNSTFNWADWYIKAKSLGLPVFGFFTFTKVNSAKGNPVLKIEGPSENTDVSLGEYSYNEAMKEIVEALGVTDFREKENEEVMKFIKKLKKFEERKNLGDRFKGILKHLLTFNSNDRLAVVTVQDLIGACPTVPWLNLLNTLAGGTYYNTSSEVAFGDIKDYCESLEKLIKSTNPSTIANYYVWSIIHQTHQYLSRDIRNAYGSIKWTYKPRFDLCFEQADTRFKYVKETVYVRKRTPKEVRDKLSEMIDIMKEIYVEHLKKCDWMDDVTRVTAIRKAKAIESLIGGTDELYEVDSFDKVLGVDGFTFTNDNMFQMLQEKNLKETRNFFTTVYDDSEDDWPSFFKNVIQLNAFFVQSLNAMILPAPILSSIFYNQKMPAFMNYGSIGRVIGHEIMHGFEKSGRYVVTDSDQIQDWWTNATADAYDKKVQCAIDEYERIPFRYRLNGTLTLDENLSDFVGIDIAYEAYMRYVKKHGTEKKLPGINLTPEQIFWVQTGTFLCFRKLDDDVVDYEEEDEHAIPQFRVQGGARHSLYFAKDFNCPEGSFMNPKEKCRIL
ncbi:hypothetical protein HHI36_000309 [Cryptolaemus montrouzieri]|uniref:Neprilysin n=1 Tax=Cryptolaemus montrouzieri TaxID=559131 RepID=A0ABD2P5D0_9CUCU